MTSGFQFWDGEIWSFIVTVALLFGAMLLANLLRRQIRFLRRSLIPSAVLGGFIILLLDSLYKRFFGHSMFRLIMVSVLASSPLPGAISTVSKVKRPGAMFSTPALSPSAAILCRLLSAC